MSNDKDPTQRETPPEDHEWDYIWSGVKKSHQGWVVVGPIVAAVTNWKAWLIIAGILAWVNGPELLIIVKAALGVPL